MIEFTYSPSPWRSLPDLYSGELHRMVVDSNGAPLFDSVNRSPAADDATEQADLMLAAAAPDLLDACFTGLDFLRLRGIDGGEVAAFMRAAIAKATGAPA